MKASTVAGSLSIHWLIPAGLFFMTFMTVAATLGDYGITWDEPPYFHASDLHIQWLSDLGKNLLRGEPRQSVQDETIKAAWHWDPYHVPHPPFSRIVSGIAKALANPFIDRFAGYRLGPALFFALLVTVMYSWMSHLFDRATGLFSAMALLAIPNLFAFAHIAVTDIPLASMWFLTAYCFWRGLDNWRWSLALGITWGLALSTKFPALLIPAPLLLWAHIFHRRDYANNICAMLFLSPVVMVASQPYLWHEPGLRILEFLYEGLSRAYRPETNYAIFFLNEIYSTQSLPWYYALYMLTATTPETILALALIAMSGLPWWQSQRPTLVLFIFNLLFILTLGLMPGAVLHDGVRQLLSVLPFLAALAGAGFFFVTIWLWKFSQRWGRLRSIANLKTKLMGAVFLTLLFNPLLDIYLSHPFQLSFYNRFVGGIPGAYERGLEMTYFMEAFTPALLKNLNATLPPNATINASVANFMFEYYQSAGRLRSDIKFTHQGPFDYYLLLNRQSVLSPVERALFRTTRPVVSVEVAGIPLVGAFRIEKPE